MTDREKLIELAEGERQDRLDDLTVIGAICETGDRNAVERIYRFVVQRKAALRARAHTSKETNNVAD
jgi:hypothetical protein